MINWNKYPYTDFHELNLDWILSIIKSLDAEMDSFVNINTIKYADPLLWNITSQYEQNTLVQDSIGTTYLSKKPVPIGVPVTNTEYWLKVADFSGQAGVIKSSIAAVDEGASTTASGDRTVNQLFWLNNYLCQIIRDMVQGDQYYEGVNYKKVTIEELLVLITNSINDTKSDLSNEITNRAESEAGINTRIDGVNTKIDSVNGEINTRIDGVDGEIDTINKSFNLFKTDRRIANVIEFGAVGDGVTDDTTAFKNAVEYAKNNNCIIYIPFGSYYLTDTIDISFDNATLIGANSVLITNGTNNVINCSTNTTVKYVHIQGITIKCNTANNIKGIVLNNTFITTLRDVETYGLGTAIHVAKCFGVSLIDCNLYNSIHVALLYDNGGASNLSNGLSLIRVNADNVDNVEQPTIGGIVCVSGEGLYALNCEIIRQRKGLYLNPQSGNGCRYYVLTNCIFDLCTDNGIIMKSASESSLYNITLSNCWSSTSGGAGVLVQNDGGNIADIRMNGLSCNNNNIGVRVVHNNGDTRGININNSSLISNSAIASGVHDAIIIEGYCTNISIMNNIIDGAIMGYLNNNHYGINIGQYVNNVIIKNNIINGCIDTPIIIFTEGYVDASDNLNAPLLTSVTIGANELVPSTDAVKTTVSGSAASPTCINMIYNKDTYVSGFYRMPNKAAYNGTLNIRLIFMCYGESSDTLSFTVHAGTEAFGASFADHVINKDITGGLKNNTIYDIDLGNLPFNVNPNDIIYFNIERTGSDTYAHNIAVLGVTLTYNSI